MKWLWNLRHCASFHLVCASRVSSGMCCVQQAWRPTKYDLGQTRGTSRDKSRSDRLWALFGCSDSMVECSAFAITLLCTPRKSQPRVEEHGWTIAFPLWDPGVNVKRSPLIIRSFAAAGALKLCDRTDSKSSPLK